MVTIVIPLGIIFLILLAHLIADFFMQSEEMALNKSKDISYLAEHSVTYLMWITMVFGLGLLFLGMGGSPAIPFVSWCLFNGLAHYVIDYFSSRCTAYLWAKKETHWFFVVIGIDQTIHYALLFWSYTFLFI